MYLNEANAIKVNNTWNYLLLDYGYTHIYTLIDKYVDTQTDW